MVGPALILMIRKCKLNESVIIAAVHCWPLLAVCEAYAYHFSSLNKFHVFLALFILNG